MRCFRGIEFVMALVALFFLGGCASYHAAQPPVAQPVSPPVAEPVPEPDCSQPCWPQLSLIGRNPSKVSLVYAEFVQLGWDAQAIKTVTGGGKRNQVMAVVTGGRSIVVPTSNRVLVRGLCEPQRAMIKGFTEYHWPKGRCCTYPVKTRTWLHARGWLQEPKAWPRTRAWPNGRTWLDAIEGPFVEEFRKTNGWRYRYGVKTGDTIHYTECLESPGRLDISRLPWGCTDWVLVMDDFGNLRILGKTVRVWRQRV